MIFKYLGKILDEIAVIFVIAVVLHITGILPFDAVIGDFLNLIWGGIDSLLDWLVEQIKQRI